MVIIMPMDPLSPNLVHLFNSQPVSLNRNRPGASNITGGFANILQESFATANQTDAIDKGSTIALLTGETDDLSGILIDAQKAELALQLALQIRNKIIDAYNEVMRMSV